jgi:hypothetical protein
MFSAAGNLTGVGCGVNGLRRDGDNNLALIRYPFSLVNFTDHNQRRLLLRLPNAANHPTNRVQSAELNIPGIFIVLRTARTRCGAKHIDCNQAIADH